jgi:hypothetical protein
LNLSARGLSPEEVLESPQGFFGGLLQSLSPDADVRRAPVLRTSQALGRTAGSPASS